VTEPPAHRITAYYDGKCPMCASLARAACGSSRSDAFDFRDMHTQQ
jgi:predicted DCC family thiol-disulfide oxidoreductase YuxK